MNRFTDKLRNSPFPKTLRRSIRLHHTNFPRPGKSSPHRMRCLRSNSTPPVSSKHKELCHVPHGLVAREVRPSFHQDEPRQFSVHPHQKRMPTALAPIQGKGTVPESSVRSNFDIVELAEIVRVQLKQASQDRLLLRSCGGITSICADGSCAPFFIGGIDLDNNSRL
jgi:hypothetical protein